jgi:hypothetical protein
LRSPLSVMRFSDSFGTCGVVARVPLLVSEIAEVDSDRLRWFV